MTLKVRVKGSHLILTGQVLNVDPVKDTFSIKFPTSFVAEVYGNTLNFKHDFETGDLHDNIFNLNWEVLP